MLKKFLSFSIVYAALMCNAFAGQTVIEIVQEVNESPASIYRFTTERNAPGYLAPESDTNSKETFHDFQLDPFIKAEKSQVVNVSAFLKQGVKTEQGKFSCLLYGPEGNPDPVGNIIPKAVVITQHRDFKATTAMTTGEQGVQSLITFCNAIENKGILLAIALRKGQEKEENIFQDHGFTVQIKHLEDSVLLLRKESFAKMVQSVTNK